MAGAYHYSDEQLISCLVNLQTNLGHVPSIAEFDSSEGHPSANTCVLRFGSWNKALRTAGLKPRREPKNYTDDQLIASLIALYEKLDHVPTMGDVDEEPSIPSSVTFSRRFGNWNLALKAAGLALNSHRRTTDEDILELIKKRASELGRVPRSRDMGPRFGYPSAMTYAKRFGSWNAALKSAELTPQRFRDYRREDLLNCLQELARALGRPPTQKDMGRNPSLPSSGPFVKQFGSWRNALREAGLAK